MPREVNSTLLLGYRWMEKCLLQKFELNKFCVLVINWQRAWMLLLDGSIRANFNLTCLLSELFIMPFLNQEMTQTTYFGSLLTMGSVCPCSLIADQPHAS